MNDHDRYDPSFPGDDSAAWYHEQFNAPAPWRRVYTDGRDITDEDPETWPWPWRDDGKPHGRKAR